MNPNELFGSIVSAMVNQALMNQQRYVNPLPSDQQEAQLKMLDAIHDFRENQKKIKSEYQAQVFDSVVLKIASENGWLSGGAR